MDDFCEEFVRVEVDGEVAGTWRYRRSDKRLTIEPSARLTPALTKAAEKQAAALAASTGDDAPSVAWE